MFNKGSAGNSFAYHNGMKFSTRDVENDLLSSGNCAPKWNGASWWLKRCFDVHLNGEYLEGGHNLEAEGILWEDFKGFRCSYKFAEMKVGHDQN